MNMRLVEHVLVCIKHFAGKCRHAYEWVYRQTYALNAEAVGPVIP